MAPNPNRRPSGTPAGGQFAPSAHPRPTISLDAEPATPPLEWSADVGRHPNGAGYVRHRFAGKLNDMADGTPAERTWYPDGTLSDSAWDPRRLHTLEVRMEHGIYEPVTEAVPD